MKELVTPAEFDKYKERVEELYDQFTIYLDKHTRVHKGGDGRKIEEWIKQAYLKFEVTEDEKQVLDGFFDTYLGTWANVQDRQLADAMMRRMFFEK